MDVVCVALLEVFPGKKGIPRYQKTIGKLVFSPVLLHGLTCSSFLGVMIVGHWCQCTGAAALLRIALSKNYMSIENLGRFQIDVTWIFLYVFK